MQKAAYRLCLLIKTIVIIDFMLNFARPNEYGNIY